MNWTFIAACLFIAGGLVLWLMISWRHPDRRSDRNPDDWGRLTGGGQGGSSDGSSQF